MSPSLTRRRALALGAGVLTAGCTTGPGSGPATDDATTDSTETTDPTTAKTPPTSSSGSTRYASETPDPDHEIAVRNEQSEDRSVRVTVVHEATGETVFEQSVDVVAGGQKPVYNLKQADPDGVERFEICASLAGASGESHEHCVNVATSACYADAEVTLEESGEVQVVYAVC